ncbi:hypothetical protein POV27_07090 [Aureisphaera galaxeae]|uniref:hypothetical protein n=1 Tax=Aureisphaera galaxeae TaxID=1538023 RepID=UPI002350F653|nr:hypothetical protein [Aureisphaera galaxeae]MDC8003810.1 hypothetical protein [Aureisphaera galaxeae]
MKTRWSAILLLGIFVGLATSCSKEDSADTNNQNNNNSSSVDQVKSIAQSGDWQVTYFWDTDSDETSDFSGYTFRFHNDGTLTATRGTTTMNGTWSVVDDDSNSSSGDSDSDDSTDDDDFNIHFPVPDTNDFEDLNDDWDIISITNNKIELIDVSGGNGGTDYLTFEKI